MVIGTLAFSAVGGWADHESPRRLIGPAVVRLQAGEVVRTAGLEVRVTCECGRVWVTQEGDGRDYVVGPGGSIALRGFGLVVVEAIDDAEVRLDPVPRSAGDRRLAG